LASRAFKVDEKALSKLSPAEQKELREVLAGVQDALKRNPLNAYVPHPKQTAFHASPARTRLYVGGNRAGKSTAGAADDLIQALPVEFVPDHLMQFKKFGFDEPFKGRVITPDLGHTMEVVINKFRELTPRDALVNQHWGPGSWDKTKRVLRFENGSTIDFMSTEQDADKFGGVDLHRVHYDEEPSGPNVETIWQESDVRLWDHDGDVILTMTPLFGVSTIVYDKVWIPYENGKKGIFAIQASVWDNPHIPPARVREEIKDWTDEERQARIEGKFVHFAGAFYEEFGEKHVRVPMTPAEIQKMDTIVGIDPGLERTAVVWVAFDNDNAAFVYAELYEHDKIPKDVAAQIKMTNLRWGVDPSFYVIDPAARIRSQVSREQIQAAYQRAGIPTIYGQNERGPGILEVKRRLQAEPPALVVSEEVRNLRREFPLYRKDPKSADDFAALKVNDHALDALRYVCMERPWATYGDADENYWNDYDPGVVPHVNELLEQAGRNQGPNPPLGAYS
jgi:phage terminase large subunit-like protein